jgi:hypothetical protein
MIHLATNSSSGASATNVFWVIFELDILHPDNRRGDTQGPERRIGRRHQHAAGWTLVGWVVALAMAARSAERQHVVVVDQRGGYPPFMGGAIGPPPPRHHRQGSDARGPGGACIPARRPGAVLVNVTRSSALVGHPAARHPHPDCVTSPTDPTT